MESADETSITTATCALHNYLMTDEFGIPNQSKRYYPAGFIDAEDRCVEEHCGCGEYNS